ncbi:MAG: hypothetical protein FWG90_01745 [Oscillospiraceae bacterium]|nr:hypothetical protein [Oscillospiraceae bacterium]
MNYLKNRFKIILRNTEPRICLTILIGFFCVFFIAFIFSPRESREFMPILISALVTFLGVLALLILAPAFEEDDKK